MEIAKDISVGLDDKYRIGIALAKKKLQGGSLRLPTNADVVRTALDAYFASIKVTRDMIEQETSKEAVSG